MRKRMAIQHARDSALRVMLAAFLIAVVLPWAPAQTTERASYAVGVDGLACPFCAYGIEKRLGRIDGVASVETDIADSVVIVMMEEGKSLEKSVAWEAVEDAGFTLGSFERRSSPEEESQ